MTEVSAEAPRGAVRSGSPRLSQAVILAGGRGSRLGALTRDCPKPMVKVGGTPFIGHLLRQLKSREIAEVVVLTGYMGDRLEAYLGDGSAWGLEVRCVRTPDDYNTAARLASASDRIADLFLLMYADVYWPLPLYEMVGLLNEHPDSAAVIAAYSNREGLTRNNLRVYSGLVADYDKTRSRGGLTHVDSGYVVCRREVLDHVPEGNPSFEEAVYPALASAGKMLAYASDQRHYSIDTVEKIQTAERYLLCPPTAFLDRDGTINRAPVRWRYVTEWADFQFIDGAVRAIELLKGAGYRVVVVSNQAGVARGMVSLARIEEIHERMREELRQHGADVDAVYICPHGWDEGCLCRKPNPGLIHRAANEMALNLDRAVMIGDSDSDMEAARRAGIPGLRVGPEELLIRTVERMLSRASA